MRSAAVTGLPGVPRDASIPTSRQQRGGHMQGPATLPGLPMTDQQRVPNSPLCQKDHPGKSEPAKNRVDLSSGTTLFSLVTLMLYLVWFMARLSLSGKSKQKDGHIQAPGTLPGPPTSLLQTASQALRGPPGSLPGTPGTTLTSLPGTPGTTWPASQAPPAARSWPSDHPLVPQKFRKSGIRVLKVRDFLNFWGTKSRKAPKKWSSCPNRWLLIRQA